MKSFNPDFPIFIGFSGPAGVGKTATAKSIVNQHQYMFYGYGAKLPPEVWNHYWFALPLYDMADIKTGTVGVDRESRILYELHHILNEVMIQRIPYDDLIELVYDIYSMPCRKDGKPREFLQNAGTLCRKHEVDCFANYIKRKVMKTWYATISEYDKEELEPPASYNIISDLRMPNEAKMIHDQANSLMIKFTASPEAIRERMEARDGSYLTPEQAAHETEQNYDNIPSEWWDYVIDTTDMSLEEQTKEVYNRITQ